MKLIAFDKDGTLEDAEGCVKINTIKKLRKEGNICGIVSGGEIEERKKWLLERNCEVDFIYQTETDTKRAGTLDYVKKNFLGCEEYIYVADRKVDEEEAIKARWKFYYPQEFMNLVENSL